MAVFATRFRQVHAVFVVQLREQTLGQDRSGQTLRDDKGIVPQRFKKFAQHTRVVWCDLPCDPSRLVTGRR